MKINAEFIQKYFLITFLILNSFVHNASFGLFKKGGKKLRDIQNTLNDSAESISNNNKRSLPDQPIYYQGWIKYLHFSDINKSKPKAFYKNTRFPIEQHSNQNNFPQAVDNEGIPYKIPSELHFYAIVYKDAINLFNTRQMGGITNVVDTLNFEYIRLIPDSEVTNGGVVDYGKFDEGFCFQVITKIPTTHFIQTKTELEPKEGEYYKEKWVICTDTLENKNKLMEKIINLKLKLQHEKNIYIEYAKTKNSNNSNDPAGKTGSSLPKDFGEVGSIYEAGKNKNDCNLIVLQKWTPCTLACGGGKSYLQLMKVQARDGGEDCKTKDTVLTRDCNLQPCPTASVVKKVLDGNKAESVAHAVANAEVKMMAISRRPQRYDKCHLKETDALMEKKDESTKEFSNYPKIPIRLVMNDKTITAYMDDTLTNKLQTYLLEQSHIIRKEGDKNCFLIQNNIRNDKFCMLDSAKGEFVEEWIYDFNLFKHQCKKDRAVSSLILSEEKRLENEFKSKIENVKLDIVQEKAQLIKKQVKETEKKKYVTKVDEVKKISLQAIEKEMRLEDLLQKEEESKEESESETLEKLVESEKKKEQCLIKAIREKQIENQFNTAKAQADRAIQQIAKATQQQILRQRQIMAKKVVEMRQKQKRKKAALKNEIMTIRTQIAERLQKINKLGSSDVCTIKDNPVAKTKYCNDNFSDNYIKHMDCEKNESFCYVCCENEFGDLHAQLRDECYAKCDKANEISSSTSIN